MTSDHKGPRDSGYLNFGGSHTGRAGLEQTLGKLSRENVGGCGNPTAMNEENA
jgi:hypothetical protein